MERKVLCESIFPNSVNDVINASKEGSFGQEKSRFAI